MGFVAHASHVNGKAVTTWSTEVGQTPHRSKFSLKNEFFVYPLTQDCHEPSPEHVGLRLPVQGVAPENVVSSWTKDPPQEPIFFAGIGVLLVYKEMSAKAAPRSSCYCCCFRRSTFNTVRTHGAKPAMQHSPIPPVPTYLLYMYQHQSSSGDSSQPPQLAAAAAAPRLDPKRSESAEVPPAAHRAWL